MGQDGTVCCVNAGHNIYRRAGRNGRWEHLPGAACNVSCNNHNDILCVHFHHPPLPRLILHLDSFCRSVVNSSDEIYRWVNGNWVRMPGACKHISVGANGHVWCVNATQHIFRHA